jgi:hypothetical protein
MGGRVYRHDAAAEGVALLMLLLLQTIEQWDQISYWVNTKGLAMY